MISKGRRSNQLGSRLSCDCLPRLLATRESKSRSHKSANDSLRLASNHTLNWTHLILRRSCTQCGYRSRYEFDQQLRWHWRLCLHRSVNMDDGPGWQGSAFAWNAYGWSSWLFEARVSRFTFPENLCGRPWLLFWTGICIREISQKWTYSDSNWRKFKHLKSFSLLL